MRVALERWGSVMVRSTGIFVVVALFIFLPDPDMSAAELSQPEYGVIFEDQGGFQGFARRK